MRFSIAAATAVFGAIAAAAPAPQSTGAPDPNTYENIDISDFTVRKNDGIQAVFFKLSGKNATDLDCSASNPGFPSDVITCGETKYRFALYPGSTTEFGLRLYHELGLAVGFYGEGDIPTYCHAGGNGPDDFVCSQVNPTTIVIDGF
ncbi:putative major allergen alt [Neofusicoccum parvum UCRNP2]|uniref:Putative major allergen alt n=1 Tax=Botryosphaeria parva (strain UCR-NP2) TaxID=1287680 RepID=R1E6W1_BOTPV|nr:putative major allergen alt [Neofusicoccum parvum UCRNP2]